MTIQFNKSVSIPKILIAASSNSTLNWKEGSYMDLDSFKIEKIIDLHVDSDYYELNSDSIKILDYTMTRLTERELDI